MLFALSLLCAQASLPASAPAAPPHWYDVLELHAMLDVDYAWNANQPATGVNFADGMGTSAHRHNQIALNLASLDVSLVPNPVGFHLALNFGDGSDIVHRGEAHPEIWRWVQQATAAYVAPLGSGLLCEAGIMPSYIGLESLQSKDNWTYTRSWMGEFSPYYFAAARAQYAFTPQWSAQVLVMNGWQVIEDNNSAKSLGAQLAYSDNRVNAALNLYTGADRAGDNVHWRAFADAFATVRVSQRVQLAASVDVGEEAEPGPTVVLVATDPQFTGSPTGPLHVKVPWFTAWWYAAQLDARVEIVRRVALVARAEIYRDDRGVITGTAQTAAAGTLTLDVRPTSFLIVKLEGRYDHSSASVFTAERLADGTVHTKRDEWLAVLGVVAYY